MQPQPVRSCPMSNLFAPSFHITPFIGMSTKIIHDALPKCERYANITKYGFPVMVEPSPRDRPLESQQCDIKYIIVNLARQAHAERAHAERGVLTRFRNLCLALCRRLLWTSAPCGCCVPVVPRWDGYGRVVVFPNWGINQYPGSEGHFGLYLVVLGDAHKPLDSAEGIPVSYDCRWERSCAAGSESRRRIRAWMSDSFQ